jgi:hypothetical protein
VAKLQQQIKAQPKPHKNNLKQQKVTKNNQIHARHQIKP